MSVYTRSRTTAKYLLLLLIGAHELAGATGSCPMPMNQPEAIHSIPPPVPRTLEPYSITQTVAEYYDAPLGLGYLEVVEENNQHYYDWMFQLALPVWDAPDASRPLGWLLHGHLYTDTGTTPLTGAGMVETEYEHTNFIVWSIHGDWLELNLSNDLAVWTHRCHLETTELKLVFVAWQAFFRHHADWLHFRKPVAHILRASPGLDGARLTTIGLDHKLELLDISGDWMHIEVTQPDLSCRDLDPNEVQPIRHRGWAKWRDERGPWVYIYTRGC